MNLINRTSFIGFFLTLLLSLVACDYQSNDTDWKSPGESRLKESNPDLAGLTIGDIDPDTPINRIYKIRPLADFLARELGWDKSRVKIRITRNIDEMVSLLEAGEVDLFIDSSYPSVLVSNASNSDIALLSLVDGLQTYQSVIIALASSNVTALKHLGGSTIALQESYSTSGHLLPTALLLNAGFELKRVDNPQSALDKNTIGFVYSGDEENTLSMLRKGIVLAGALSSQDFSQLPDEVKKEFTVLARSPEVPRKLASFRHGLDEDFRNEVIEKLLSISDDDRLIMTRNNGWNWQFEKLDAQSTRGIDDIRTMIEQLEGDLN